MTPWKIETIKSSTANLNLRVGTFTHPDTQESQITQLVFFFTGRGEWIEKHINLAADLSIQKHQKLVIWDHRGQGGSDGERSHVKSYDDFSRDAQKVIHHYSKGRKFYTISHSMGGLIALNGYMKGLWKPQGMILSSPLMQIPNKPIPRFLAKPIVSILCMTNKAHKHASPSHSSTDLFINNDLTHDIHSFRRNSAQPFKYTPPTFGWVNATFKAIYFINRVSKLKKIDIPLFIIGGGAEAVVDSSAWPLWAQKAQKYSQSDVDFKIIHGARHELFTEIKKYKFQALKLCERWLKKQKIIS